MSEAKNIFGEPLKICGQDPVTGFYRNGYCETGADDLGVHVVCAVVTDAFLEYSRAQGNDLIRPNPSFGFPGLKQGDAWCLCAGRWYEAHKAGKAPMIDPHATHERALDIVPMDVMVPYFLKQSRP